MCTIAFTQSSSQALTSTATLAWAFCSFQLPASSFHLTVSVEPLTPHKAFHEFSPTQIFMFSPLPSCFSDMSEFHHYSFCKKLKVYYFYFIYLNVLPACMSMFYMHVWCPQRPEGVLGPLELELPRIVIHHMNAGNQTRVFFKSNKHLWLLSHLSSPPLSLFFFLLNK